MGEGREEIHRRHTKAEETALGAARNSASTEEACRMGQITQTGAWLLVFPYTVNGTESGAQEWKDYLLLR